MHQNKTSALTGGGKRMRHTSVDVVVRVCPTLNTGYYTLLEQKVNPIVEHPPQ